VQIFFVLSGFLITRILINDLVTFGTIRFGHFFARRLRRLAPALLITCAGYVVYAIIWRPGESALGIVGTVIRAVTYTSNLDPLLEWLPDNHWLNHTWSLAVEEQFYLVWPGLLALSYRLHPRAPVIFVLLGAVAFVPLRAMSSSGTLAYELLRFDALLLGCASALLPDWRAGRGLQMVGLMVAGWYLIAPPRWFGPWDFLICAAASLMILHHALSTRWMASPFLVYFGRISYGLYLLHVLFLRPGLPPWLALAFSIGLAHLSYFYFEQRFLTPDVSPDPNATSVSPVRPVEQHPG